MTLEGISKLSGSAKVMVLKSSKLDAVNSIDDPNQVSPIEQDLKIKGKKISIALAPESFTVIKIVKL